VANSSRPWAREAGRTAIVVFAALVALVVAWWISALVLAATGDKAAAVLVAIALTVGLPAAAVLWKHGLRFGRVTDAAGFALGINVALATLCIVAMPDPLGLALRGHGWALSASALGEQHRATRLTSLLSYEIADAVSEPPEPPVRVDAGGESIIVEVELRGPAGTRTVPYLWDTGASYTTITSSTAKELGIAIPDDAPRVAVQTAAGDRETSVVLLPSLTVAGTEIEGLAVSLCDDCEHERTEGLLGLNAMRFFSWQHDPSTRSLNLSPRPDAAAMNRVGDVAPFVRIELQGSPDLVRGHAHWIVNLHNDSGREVLTPRVAAEFEGGATLLGSNVERIAPGESVQARIVGSAGRGATGRYRLVLDAARW
jgi:clan AA aspartic protease (TIGR02281 family)